MFPSADLVVVAALLGVGVGLVLAMTGAGGGMIAVPLLVFGLDLPVQLAGPVGLLAVLLAAGVGALLGWRQGILRYRAAALVGVCGMLMAPVGVALAQRLPNRPLLLAFALLLAWTAWQTLRRTLGSPTVEASPTVSRPCQIRPESGRFAWNLRCAALLSGSGLVSGVLSGLLGVGGGFVVVPVLNRYSNLSSESVIATSLGVMTLIAIGGIAAAALSGGIVWRIGLPFAGGAVAGLLAGRLIAARVGGRRLQQGFGVLSLIVAISLFRRGLGIGG